MSKKTKVIIGLTLLLFVMFFALALVIYPRILWWFTVVGKKSEYSLTLITTTAFGGFGHYYFSAFMIAVTGLFIGIGTYIISKKRNLKETLIGCFVLVDVAVVVMLGWLGYLKYRLLSVAFMQPADVGTIGIDVANINLFELSIAASIAVLLVAWVYPKKFEDAEDIPPQATQAKV